MPRRLDFTGAATAISRKYRSRFSGRCDATVHVGEPIAGSPQSLAPFRRHFNTPDAARSHGGAASGAQARAALDLRLAVEN
jgi:hypothetical protein